MSRFTPTTRVLMEQMAKAPRGPRRDGLFAVWLAVRAIEDLPGIKAPGERAFRRRVALVEKRISSLALGLPLRRALNQVLASLKDADRADAGKLLGALAAPARDGIGAEAAEALSRGSRAAR